MRTKLRSKVTLLFVMCAVLIAIPAVAALADIVVVNEAGVTGDSLKKPGGTGTARVYLTQSNDDPANDVSGCNANTSNPVSVTLGARNPNTLVDVSDITFTGNPVSITSCDDPATTAIENPFSVNYTVASGAADGTVEIYVKSVTGGRTQAGGTITSKYTATDTHKVRIDGTGPAITINTPPSGASYDINDVVNASYSCDDGAGNAGTTECIGTAANGSPINTSSEGTKTFTVNAKDALGNTSTLSRSYEVVNPDSVAPTSTHSLSAAANANGWHNQNVTVTLNATDNDGGSGVDEIRYSINGGTNAVYDSANKPVISTEGTTTFSYFAVDNNNNEENPANSFQIKLDKTDPTGVSGSPDSAANGNGWYNSPVSFTFTGTDPLSGIASCSTPTYSGPDGNSQTVSGSCTDKAGNESDSVASSAIKYDATAPVITNVGADSTFSTPNAADWYKTDVKHEFSASDNLSGFTGGVTTQSIFKTITQEGSAVTTTSGTVTDLAGNVSNSETSPGYKIDKTAPTLNPSVSPNPVVLNGSATASPNASDALSTIASASCDPVLTSTAGPNSVNCSATDKAGNTASKAASYNVGFNFVGFASPVDNGNYLNVLKAGQAIPLKWRLLDANDNPVTNLTSASISVKSLSCATGSTDLLEEVAAGGSSLQNLGNGYYQYNWKSPTSYANSCKTLLLDLGEGTPRTANFKFNK